MTAEYKVADVFDGLATLGDDSVDLVVTSPPFLALRSYLPADHPDKHKEMGSEPTPAAFIDSLLAVMAELRRVLAPHGSVCVELGDTYSGGDTRVVQFKDAPQDEIAAGNHLVQYEGHPMGAIRNMNNKIQPSGPGWPLAKSLSMIPESFRLALAYGFNPHTGQESPAGKWRVRNTVRWVRPNPPVGALGDKWRPATSDLVVACTSGKRFWDDIATRRPVLHPNGKATLSTTRPVNQGYEASIHSTSGAPLLDWWEIPPGGYPGSHYAVFPPDLVEPCVKAMCPQRVCVECGEPSRRIVERERINGADDSTRIKHANGERPHPGRQARAPEVGWEYERTDLGFSDCGHDSWRPGKVLDPFAGSGTTLLVADALGYDTVGIDIDERNRTLYESRRDDRAFTLRRQAELF